MYNGGDQWDPNAYNPLLDGEPKDAGGRAESSGGQAGYSAGGTGYGTGGSGASSAYGASGTGYGSGSSSGYGTGNSGYSSGGSSGYGSGGSGYGSDGSSGYTAGSGSGYSGSAYSGGGSGYSDGGSSYSGGGSGYSGGGSVYSPGSGGSGGKPGKPKKKKSARFAVTIIAVALAAALLGSVGGGLIVKSTVKPAGNVSSSSGTSNSNTVPPQKVTIENEVESMVEAVYAKCADSVVGISTSASMQSFFGGSSTSEIGEGSGVVYSADGYIITNYHVISDALEYQSYVINIYFASDPDNAVPASVVGYNVASDLAVLKVDKTGLLAVEVGKSSDLQIGQYVVAIGCPGGIEFMGSASYGIISGLNRSITVEQGSTMTLIQTDAAINPGNSGGALLDSKGRLIGINSAKFVDESFEGMGFSIPVDNVVEICDRIIARKDQPTPYIGIEVSKKYDEQTLARLGYPAGAVVLGVDEGSPAEKAGLRRGDIVTQFNGKDIKSYTDLISLTNDSEPGETVKIRFYRSGRSYDTTLKVGSNS